jgi:endonuclease/exonuclease/phosphatase family metal-dependent hydrolase
VHPRLKERIQGAGKAIAEGGYDVVGLQELWLDGDGDALALTSRLPHAARFGRAGAAFGSGLAILSRWPVLSKEERAFSSVRPSLRHPLEGEAVPSKGFLFARLSTPWGELDAYAAHTLADYPEAQYHFLRLTELFELAEGVRELSRGRPFVILGDLNSGRGDREYELFLDLLGLRDACDRNGEELCPDPDHVPRIDHILASGALAVGRRVLGAEPRLSDHFGFAADFPRALMALRAKPDPKRRAAALRAVSEAAEGAIARLSLEKRRSAWIPLYGAFLAARCDRQIASLRAIGERAATAGL